MSVLDLVRRNIRGMAGYVPGEQPAPHERVIKLNTNENPYEPPGQVLDALAAGMSEKLRLYPSPDAQPVREAAAQHYDLSPSQVIVGNGSDDILTMIFRTFLEPGGVVAAPEPTYSLYRTLTAIQDGNYIGVPWGQHGALPQQALCETNAKITFIVRPNSPTGHVVSLQDVRNFCRAAPGLVVLDEAYVDFCEDHGLGLLADHPNLLITRTFSKSLSLAGLRLGLGFGNPLLLGEMHKVRDSYNVDALAQEAAVAALNHFEAFLPRIDQIKTERAKLTSALEARGFQVTPSQANFVLAEVPVGERTGAQWLAALREHGILVRFFGKYPELASKLRISIGSAEEMLALLKAVDELL